MESFSLPQSKSKLSALITVSLMSSTIALMGIAHANTAQNKDTKPEHSSAKLLKQNSTEEILKNAPADAWQTIPQSKLVYVTLGDDKRVIFELAEEFAPAHADRIRLLAKQNFWENASVYRVQDNYVAQFGWFDFANDKEGKELPDNAKDRLPVEVARPVSEVNFVALPDIDPYADKTGFVGNFPASVKDGQAFALHCYGAIGVSRDVGVDSGTTADLYAVIGQPPRHLDRQIVVVGRVLQGIEHLSSLKRGDGVMGFYTNPAKDATPIKHIRTGDMLPKSEQVNFTVLRSDSKAFMQLIEERRKRTGEWFIAPLPTHIDPCYVPQQIKATNNDK